MGTPKRVYFFNKVEEPTACERCHRPIPIGHLMAVSPERRAEVRGKIRQSALPLVVICCDCFDGKGLPGGPEGGGGGR